MIPALLCAILAASCAGAGEKETEGLPANSALDAYVKDSTQRDKEAEVDSPGSIWSPSSRLADLGRDVRASKVDDLVTIVVAENASAVSTGQTKTSRASSVNSSITGLAGPQKATGTLANLRQRQQRNLAQRAGHHLPHHHAKRHPDGARYQNSFPTAILLVEGPRSCRSTVRSRRSPFAEFIRPADPGRRQQYPIQSPRSDGGKHRRERSRQ